jgi:hypothetical protein
VLASPVADLLILPCVACAGTLMAPLPFRIINSVFCTAFAFAFVFNELKARVFRALGME